VIIDYLDKIVDQMKCSRYRDGRHERLENGEWVPWPILSLDRLGVEEAGQGISPTGRSRGVP
jgi:hypothetical protein